jgi:hypothetical protein
MVESSGSMVQMQHESAVAPTQQSMSLRSGKEK